MHRKGIQFRFFLGLIVVAVIPLLLFGMYGYQSSSELVQRMEVQRISANHASLEKDIETFFTKAELDMEFVKAMLGVDWMSHGGISREDFLEHTTDTYVAFMATHGYYDQIRLLNESGYEVVRVNNAGNRQWVVPENRLQDKSNRYYFETVMDMVDGEIYLSPIDLNVENDVIEEPHKAVVRYIAPMDLVSQSGYERFYLVMNLNVSSLLETLRESIETGDYKATALLDENGFYMLHPLRQKEWGGPDNLGTGESIQSDMLTRHGWQDAGISDKVLGGYDPGFAETQSEIIYWTPLHITSPSGLAMTIMSVKPKSEFMAPVYGYLKSYMGLIVSTFFILAVMSSMIASKLSKPIIQIAHAVSEIGKGKFKTPLEVSGGIEIDILAYEIKKMAFELEGSYTEMESRVKKRTAELQAAHDQMEAMANTDPLTGIFNRHYFNNYIESFKKDQRKTELALIMLDVDKFKHINDHYGHNVGDIVLVEVAKLLSSKARGSDFVVRYGGDEFLIALKDSDITTIHAYIQRIKDALEVWNRETDILEHDMEFSIGYDVYEEGKHIMDVIRSADERMYENKMARRKERGEI